MIVHSIADGAGGVVEIDVHSTLAGGGELLREIWSLVVDGRVEAE
jgi:hypothetical protein